MIYRLLFILVSLFLTTQTLFANVNNDFNLNGELEEIIRFDALNFENNSLSTKDLNNLKKINNKIKNFLKNKKDIFVVIVAHSNSNNPDTSLSHIYHVKSHILKSRIDKNKIIVQSKKSQPDRVVVSIYMQKDYDKDKDGVLLPHDECPDTPLGTKVSDNGCKAATIIMLMGNDKTKNAIVVQTGTQELVIDKPGAYTLVTSKNEMTTDLPIMPIDEMNNLFGDVVASSNKKKHHFILYFKGLDILDPSKKAFNEMISILSKKDDYFINVVGHTDTLDSVEYNKKLSKNRADKVIDIILLNKVKYLEIKKEFYGESDLAVKTRDSTYEPLNRRVEVFIH